MGHDFGPWGNAEVFGSNVVPFLDLTLKGFVWYQGENNMFCAFFCAPLCAHRA